MIEFFQHYIDPSSPARAKIAVHLNAQTPATTESSVTAVLEKGLHALGINKDKKDEEDGEAIVVKAQDNGTTPFVITDVREFKSQLQVSAGPQPVKHISEFEELSTKL